MRKVHCTQLAEASAGGRVGYLCRYLSAEGFCYQSATKIGYLLPVWFNLVRYEAIHLTSLTPASSSAIAGLFGREASSCSGAVKVDPCLRNRFLKPAMVVFLPPS